MTKLKHWQFYWQFYAGLKKRLWFAVVVAVGQSLVVLPVPFLVRRVFDSDISAGNINHLILAGIIIVGLYFVNLGMTFWSRHSVVVLVKTVIQRLREELLRGSYLLPRSYYAKTDMEKIHIVIVQDTERLDIMSVALMADFLPAVIATGIFFLILLYLNISLLFTMLAVAPIFYLVSRKAGKVVQENTRSYHGAFEKFSKGVLFALKMMDLTHIRSAEESEMERQSTNIHELRDTSRSLARSQFAYALTQNGIVACSQGTILVAGGTLVASGAMTLGELISFYVAVAFLRNYWATISFTLPQIITGRESLKSLYQIATIDAVPEYNGKEKISFNGTIELAGVDFGYDGKPLLKKVTLSAGPGRVVALIGPSGAGKSTVINLMLGFYRPTGGRIAADGRLFDRLDMASLRRQIGVVLQEPMVFFGTIFDNIAYGASDASLEKVILAAKLACGDEFIASLPQGYNTLVGDSGVLLSGGQRQRLAIARALLRRPRLLILDEPTNHLDRQLIDRITANLRSLDKEMGLMIVSHDSELVKQCDYVYLLDKGQLLSEGTPESIKL